MEKAIRLSVCRVAVVVMGLYTCLPLSAAPICRATHHKAVQDFKSSRQLRHDVLEHFESRLKKVTDTQGFLLKKALREIEKRGAAQDSLNQAAPKLIGGMKMDFSQLPGAMAKETLAILEALYGSNGKSLDETARADFRKLTFEALDRDPYFQWLHRNQKTGDPDMADSSSPSDYFISLLEDAGPMALKPQVAFLQVYRDADPFASHEQIKVIDDVLKLHRVEMTLREDIENLRSNNGNAGPKDARGLAPNLLQAHQNLHELLQNQVSLHGGKFPRRSYEAASKLFAKNDPDIRVLSNMKIFTGWKNVPPEISIRLESLKTRIGLLKEFPAENFYQAMLALQRSNQDPQGGSYETFLVRAFEKPASSPVLTQILNLRTMIEFIEAKQDESAWSDLLKDHERRLFRFWENP
ncbi:MAG: hypothetical protein ACXWC9_06270 [Pseudobdellovibrionaceae bacterium]